MPKVPAPVPQGASGGTHGALGVPVQITQRISLRPGAAGGPPAGPAGAPPSKPKKETQRFALAPAPTQQVAAEVASEAGDRQRLILPLGMVLRSLPPEVLSTDLGQLLARPVVAGGTVSVPMDQVLRQLPTGVVQFTFDVLQPQIPAEMLQPADQLATHWDRPVRLPLGEVVSRIPAEAMGVRGPVADQPSEFESIDAPFRVRPSGPRGRRTSRLSAPVEEPVAAAVAQEAPPPSPPAMPAAEPSGAAPFDFEGFQPFRKAAPPAEPGPMADVGVADVGLASEMPFSGGAVPEEARPSKAALPDLGITAVQKAPTMGITGQISLDDVDQDAEIQREPTQRLGKPPPGLIAVRPPATSSLPFVEHEEAVAPGVPEAVASPVEAMASEPAGVGGPGALGGGLSALASLAAMADSGPIDEEEAIPAVPETKAAEPAPEVGPSGGEGAWWQAAPGGAPEAGEERPAEGEPKKGSLADLATQWLAMQQDMPFEGQGPAAAAAPPRDEVPEPKPALPDVKVPPAAVAPVEPPAGKEAKNWWEMPLGEPGLGDEVVVASKEPEAAEMPAAEMPGRAEAGPPAEAPGEVVEPTGFSPLGIGVRRDKRPPAVTPKEPPAPIFAEKALLTPEAAPGFVPPLSAVVPDILRKGAGPPRGPSAPPVPPIAKKPQPLVSAPMAAAPPGGAPILPLTPKGPRKPPQPPMVAPVPPPEPEPIPEAELEPEVPEFVVESAPPPAPIRPKPSPAPVQRKPVALPSAGRIGAQGRPKGAAPVAQPKRETEIVGAPRQRSPLPVPKMRADRLSGLLRAASSWKPPGAAVASRPINPRRILSRWLGLEVEREIPIHQVPALLVNSPHVKGAAIVDEEGLALTSQLPEGVSEQAVGALSSRLFNQLKTAATEVGSQFANQAIMTLGRWTVQITYEKPFYLVTLHDSPHFPPAVARRMRKIAGALVRQEFGG